MKRFYLFFVLLAAGLVTYAQHTVALADAHWGFEASEATTLVGQYNSADRYVPAGWTSSNGYQSASTQYKPYIVANGTNIYASEGTQALHIEGTSTYNLPYVILPAITGVDNYNDLTLVFKVRPGYWSDFGGGEGMWSKCGSSDCRTIKVGHLTEIPDRENFASSVTNVWDTTFNAAGMFDPASANPFCEVRIPMNGFGQYVAIYCEANANCYFCIDEVSIEGGEPTATDPYNVALANAEWNFSDISNTKPAINNAAWLIPNNWVVGCAGTKAAANAYICSYYPNQNYLDKTYGYDGQYCFRVYGIANTQRVPSYAVLPAISDANYDNLYLTFYGRTELSITSSPYYGNLRIGYITDIADTLSTRFVAGNTHFKDTTLNATAYQYYEIPLNGIPAGAHIVLYDDDANTLVSCLLDNIKIIRKTATPDPEPEPTPLTKEALQDSINWWVPSVAHAGTTARATFILHFQNGDIAYGYEWDGSATNAMAAMDEIVAADPDLSAEKTNAGTYFTTFTCGELTNTMSWGWGVSKNDAGLFSAHNALALADGDMIIFSYDDMSVPKLAALTDVIFVEEKEAPATTFTINYTLTGCSAVADNLTVLTEDTTDISLDFTLAEGYTWAGAEITVTMGEEVITTDYEEDNWYMWTAARGNLYIFVFEGVTADVHVTVTAKKASAFPTVFAPATFEDITVGSNGVFYDPAITLGVNEWLSGSFLFATFYDNGYGSDYYSDIIVSSLVDPTMEANYSNPVSYLYAPVATPQGNNFAVWNQSFYGVNPVKMGAAQVVSGMYVNNVSALLNYITDAFSTFPANGYFKLIVTGYNNGVQTNTVNYYLVDWRDAENKKTVTNWEWLDLTSLGSVDELHFDVDSDDGNEWGLLIPAYFCFDNLGGEAPTPTAIESTFDQSSIMDHASKIIRNGQLLIIRGEHIYNVAGQVVR